MARLSARQPACYPPYSGERLNLHYAISVCLDNAEVAARRRARMAEEQLRPAA